MNKVSINMSCGLQLFQTAMEFMIEQTSVADLILEIQVAGPFVTITDIETDKTLVMQLVNYSGKITTSVKEKDGEEIPGPEFVIYRTSELEEYIQTLFGLEV